MGPASAAPPAALPPLSPVKPPAPAALPPLAAKDSPSPTARGGGKLTPSKLRALGEEGAPAASGVEMDSFSSEDLDSLMPQPMTRRGGSGPTTARLAARAPQAPASMMPTAASAFKPAAAPAASGPGGSAPLGGGSSAPVKVPAGAAMSAGLAAARAAAQSPGGRSLGASSSGHDLLEESLGDSINLDALLP